MHGQREGWCLHLVRPDVALLEVDDRRHLCEQRRARRDHGVRQQEDDSVSLLVRCPLQEGPLQLGRVLLARDERSI